MEKDRKLKVLFILPEYYPHSRAGISTYYIHYIRAIKPLVAQIKVLVGSGYTQSDQSFDLDGIVVEYLNPELFSLYLEKFQKFELFPDFRKNVAAAWAMWHQANQGDGFDMIECTDFGLGFIPWLTNHDKPVVVRLHGSSGQIQMHEPHLKETLAGDLYRHTELNLLQRADHLITHSQTNKCFWENILGRSVQLIAPVFEQQKNSIGFDKKANYGIVTGRVQEWKGPDLLCKAVAELKDTDLEIRWYGRDTSFDSKKSKSEMLEENFPQTWGNKIQPQPPVEHEILKESQRHAKFAIIPSTWDMYNLAGLEYLDAGTVLICSDGAGVAEIIEDGINGFKYPKDDFVALAKCIHHVQNLQKADYERLVNAGKAIFQSKLSVDKLLRENLAIYLNAAANFHPNIANAFNAKLFVPSSEGSGIEEILDKQPMRKLVNYLFTRIKRKLK